MKGSGDRAALRHATVGGVAITLLANVLEDSVTLAMKEQTVKNPAMEDMDWAVRHHATVRFNVIASPASVLPGGAKRDGKETTARHPVMVECGDLVVRRCVTVRNSVTTSQENVR